MLETIKIRLDTAQKTRFAGECLARTLYRIPMDIELIGALGAGKTTFLQGLATGLGIDDHLSSPTYALEQRYETATDIPFIHIDLYRLNQTQAVELIRSTDDHQGIRCIEWADRLPDASRDSIVIHLSEDGDGRSLTVTFNDFPFPPDEMITAWRNEFRLPENVSRHCDAVARLASALTDDLLSRACIIRPQAVRAAALVHDVLRFIDFKDYAAPPGIERTDEEQAHWDRIKQRFPAMKHEMACALLLREHGFEELAAVVEVHGLHLPSPERTTIEQKILYYADKRVMNDRVVTLDERFDDFTKRYSKGVESEHGKIWRAEAQKIEDELFPDGPPL